MEASFLLKVGTFVLNYSSLFSKILVITVIHVRAFKSQIISKFAPVKFMVLQIPLHFVMQLL